MSQPAILETQGKANTEKTPLTRLLDLLAGWSQFVSTEDANSDSASAEEIADLYQAAGAIEVEGAEEAEQVRQFVQQRILPILLRTESVLPPHIR